MIQKQPYTQNGESECDSCSKYYDRKWLRRYRLNWQKDIKLCPKCHARLISLMAPTHIHTIIQEHAEMEAAILGDHEYTFGSMTYDFINSKWLVSDSEETSAINLEDRHLLKNMIKGRINNENS